ncbi:PH (Pleckstrin Homology) domain-containing protein [Nocardioides albertanoniae]|uniref:PH (Pleckstrin Homology) domain-containing protein n=1 Tax=Nocardioides albertanoniae TaxID=1175486 RepID=A0A543A8B9_9ACTN|nr:PH domain-containing protein [Nocardioides albertanoniae]TQL68779.1 PH (Pleckstrin Homology) domain-containing protein [Nocardioides albertanoniae]
MPAASEPDPASADGVAVTLPHTWRPFGVRVMGWMLVIALAVMMTVVWVGFTPEIKAQVTTFEKLTLAALGIGVLVCMHALTRSRVVASEAGLTVVNGYKRRDLEWAEILAINFPRGAPWPNIDLASGHNISMHGIQASDGGSSRKSVRTLRALVAAHS